MSLRRFICEDCGCVAYRYARGDKQNPCEKCGGKICGRTRFTIRRRGPAEFTLATCTVNDGDAVEVLSCGQWLPARIEFQSWSGPNPTGSVSVLVKAKKSDASFVMNEVRWPRARKT